ncbi:hypothetical protein [Nocardia sp. NPDC051570]|uniref:hypothetical protein n=1 Tax=Nocardia sp. NPDC051570 TaxID=3364324 RepID=UPI0037876C29
MTVQREERWLVATRSAHVAYEVERGWFRLSLAPERLVTGAQAVAGLTVAEIAADWNALLWEDDANVAVVWKLIGAQAKPLGLDPLEAVIRCEQSEWPTTAAEWAVWSR